MNVAEEFIYYAHSLPSDLEEVWLVPISDVHYGNPFFSPKHLDRTVKFIAENPHVYTFLNGDLCECVTKSSVGDLYAQRISPQEQRDAVIEMLSPLRGKVLGVTTGNHEMRIWRDSGIDISSDIAKALSAPYRSEGMMLKISFGKGNRSVPSRPFVFYGYFTHGYGGARTKSAKAVKVERVGTWLNADWYAMSHDHVVNVGPDLYLVADPRTRLDPETGYQVGPLVAHRKMLVKTNAYIKWGGYSEMGGFPPVDLQTPIIKLCSHGGGLWPAKSHVRVEV